MPKKVRVVDGPYSISGFVDEPIRWHRAFMVCMLCSQVSDSDDPAVKTKW